MLNGFPILIAEDDPEVAGELAFAIECLEGRPIGPAATVADALAILDREKIEAAILDATLADGDVTPLGLRLAERAVPFVVHSGSGLPARLAAAYPDLPVILKPALPSAVLDALLQRVSPDRSRFAQ